MTIDTEVPLFRAGKQSAARLDKDKQNCRESTSFLVLFYIRYRSYLRLLVPGCGPYYFPIDLSRHITRRKVCGQCRSFGNGHCLSGRLSNCVSSCGLFGGGFADADESYKPLPALKRRLWRLLKAGSPLSLPPHCTKALARSECSTTKGLHCLSRW